MICWRYQETANLGRLSSSLSQLLSIINSLKMICNSIPSPQSKKLYSSLHTNQGICWLIILCYFYLLETSGWDNDVLLRAISTIYHKLFCQEKGYGSCFIFIDCVNINFTIHDLNIFCVHFWFWCMYKFFFCFCRVLLLLYHGCLIIMK